MSETWEAYWEKLRTMSREERRGNNPFAQAAADCILDYWAKLEAARVALSNEMKP